MVIHNFFAIKKFKALSYLDSGVIPAEAKPDAGIPSHITNLCGTPSLITYLVIRTFLILICLFTWIQSVSAQVTASGAGSSYINVTYPYWGTQNGKSYYYYNGSPQFGVFWARTGSQQWEIYDATTSTLLYANTNNTATPPATGWTVVNGASPAPTISGDVTVVSCTNPTSGGTIATAQTGCTPFNPAAFTSSAAASGEAGTLEYKWQYSVSPFSTWNDIGSTNSATYDPPAGLTVTTRYKRLARVSCQSDWTGAAESNVIEVTISPASAGGVAKW